MTPEHHVVESSQKRKTSDVTSEKDKRVKHKHGDLSEERVGNYERYLHLYFRSRCDDMTAWNQLQHEAESDDLANALVCDVLMHNDGLQAISKDIARAQHISESVHRWVAATESKKDSVTYATKKYVLGICLAQGIGTPQDSYKAMQCIDEAAELGNCLAQYYKGVWYRDGRFIEKDLEAAVRHFKLAASQEHPIALNMLGLCYATGQGVDCVDTARAEEYYRRSAELGCEIAQANLDDLLEKIASC